MYCDQELDWQSRQIVGKFL